MSKNIFMTHYDEKRKLRKTTQKEKRFIQTSTELETSNKMARPNNKKNLSTVDEKSTIKVYGATNYSHCVSNIFRTKAAQSTQKTMTRTNAHRKNRNSREKHSKLPETFHISTITSTPSPFVLSIPPPSSSAQSFSFSSWSLTCKASHFVLRLCKSALVILMLAVLVPTRVSCAITQSSHSETVTMALTTMSPAAGEATTFASISVPKYSQPLTAEGSDDNGFRPIIPKDMNLEAISQNVFTKTGQYRVFEPIDSDLRATAAIGQAVYKAMNIPPYPAEDLRPFNKQSEVVTLQTKRKVLLTEMQETYGEETSIKQQKTQTMNGNRIKETESTKETSFDAKPNQFKLKASNAQQAPNTEAEDQRFTARSKQLLSNTFHPLSVNKTSSTTPTGSTQAVLSSEINGLENLLAEYVDNFFNKGEYQPKPELIIALQQNFTEIKETYQEKIGKYLPDMEKNRPVRQALKKSAEGEISVNLPRAFESGRLLFFAGLKKVMWPIYMGLQVLKSLMFALLLPTLIGSFGKLLGKGISSGSAPLFIRPMDEPQDLDFRDNNFNFDDDSNKFTLMDDSGAAGGNVKDAGYAYNQAEASQTHNQYAYNVGSINQQALSRYGMNERQQLMQDSYLSALQSLGAASFKNSNGLSGSSSGSGGGGGGLASIASPMRQKPISPANTNTFQQFQKVPASSLLLSNYDPFYSPLLSRLDSVFAQLKLNSDDEACREKLICLMYANPAKYAPYSNLVSAQLSRELNELRKPTSDNPDILRFFKYMRAAKDGQDGIDCEKSFDKCKEFKDFENPAMVSTYHDINKLVQARKFS